MLVRLGRFIAVQGAYPMRSVKRSLTNGTMQQISLSLISKQRVPILSIKSHAT